MRMSSRIGFLAWGSGVMRTFLAEFDRAAAIALGTGLILGLVWLAAPGPGVVFGALAAVGGAVAWIVRSRWLPVSLVLLGTGLVPAIGYRLFGRPEVPETIDERAIPVEAFAPAAADLFTLAGLIGLALVTFIGVREGIRRERHSLRGQARRAQRPAGDGS